MDHLPPLEMLTGLALFSCFLIAFTTGMGKMFRAAFAVFVLTLCAAIGKESGLAAGIASMFVIPLLGILAVHAAFRLVSPFARIDTSVVDDVPPSNQAPTLRRTIRIMTGY
jgi:hypothetical protein